MNSITAKLESQKCFNCKGKVYLDCGYLEADTLECDGVNYKHLCGECVADVAYLVYKGRTEEARAKVLEYLNEEKHLNDDDAWGCL